MIRLHIIAEGQTEQNFVKQILTPHLAQFDVFADARCVMTSRDKHTSKFYRGGLSNYEKPKKDILAWLNEDHNEDCRFTTMFDLYGLPDDFPGYTIAKAQSDPYMQVKIIEDNLGMDINDSRFIPYIQLHEFEALILADPKQLAFEYLEHDKAIHNLISMVGDQNPELINDGRETAPSKRIISEIKAYKKTTAGVAVVAEIGLPTLRGKCRHFKEWISNLERLAGKQP